MKLVIPSHDHVNAILAWKAATDLRGEPFRSPLTGEPMRADMRPNHALKALIVEFAPM